MKKLYFFLVILFLSTALLNAKEKESKIQRNPTGVFDYQENTVSDFQFPLTNNGILFLDVPNLLGGGFWPRGSSNQYFFGGGIWFLTKKGYVQEGFPERMKLSEVTYDPNYGTSWMVPGCIDDGDAVDSSRLSKYRIYFSSDMNTNGTPFNLSDGPNWPLWKSNDDINDNLGIYISNVENRTQEIYPLGPAFISDEDIFCTFKDTDLNHYGDWRKDIGYPLGLQWEQTIFSWVDEEKKDMIIINYKLKNTSVDTLLECWLAPIYDLDIMNIPPTGSGSQNDIVMFYDQDTSLNLGISWTLGSEGEEGKNFGYVGISLLTSPSIDDNGFLEKGFESDVKKQIGLKTFIKWPKDHHVSEASRYDFASYNVIEKGIGEQNDYKILLATGPFHMAPGDVAYCAVQINFAMPSLGGEATGETEDLVDLVNKVKLGQNYFWKEIITKVLEQDLYTDQRLLIYPNPVSDFIYLKNVEESDKIEILSSLGVKVYECKYKNKIDVTTLSAGLYFIKIGNRITKFIKY